MKNARQRQNARKLLIQALYSLDLGGSTPAKIEKDFLAEKSMSRVDEKFFHDVTFGVPVTLGVKIFIRRIFPIQGYLIFKRLLKQRVHNKCIFCDI